MKLTSLLQLVDKLQQACKIDNLQQVCGVLGCVCKPFINVFSYLSDSWVYDQAVLHKDQGEDIVRDTREYYSESKPTKNRPDR